MHSSQSITRTLRHSRGPREGLPATSSKTARIHPGLIPVAADSCIPAWISCIIEAPTWSHRIAGMISITMQKGARLNRAPSELLLLLALVVRLIAVLPSSLRMLLGAR